MLSSRANPRSSRPAPEYSRKHFVLAAVPRGDDFKQFRTLAQYLRLRFEPLALDFPPDRARGAYQRPGGKRRQQNRDDQAQVQGCFKRWADSGEWCYGC
jgi:hypothetical protein